MKAHLMFRDRDFNIDSELPVNSGDLIEDLELDILFDTMASGDKLLRKAAERGMLTGLAAPDSIRYRQGVLEDCLSFPTEIRDFYNFILQSIEGEKKALWLGYGHHPSTILSGAVKVVKYYLDTLRELRRTAEALSLKFESEGFGELFTMLKRELDDEYLSTMQFHVKNLEFHHGLSICASLGKNGKGADYTLSKPNRDNRSWLGKLLGKKAESYSWVLPPQDDTGARCLSELQDRGINSVAQSLAQSAEHIRGFYILMRDELSFYIGCLNLYDRLQTIGVPVCFPEVYPSSQNLYSYKELCDVCLSLTMNGKAIGNDGVADKRNIVIITGANQGGKSTFLRSVGLSYLMMQCGMFSTAVSLKASVCEGIFTHFKRQEDSEMNSGKFDEELKRMSGIVDSLSSESVILFNESFSSTNEREGAEIARQIVSALAEKGVRLFFVTHLFQFSQGFFNSREYSPLFLRAERQDDGTRTFKLIEAGPMETSFGRDLYYQIFEDI